MSAPRFVTRHDYGDMAQFYFSIEEEAVAFAACNESTVLQTSPHWAGGGLWRVNVPITAEIATTAKVDRLDFKEQIDESVSIGRAVLARCKGGAA
jgi:hypothetical protein